MRAVCTAIFCVISAGVWAQEPPPSQSLTPPQLPDPEERQETLAMPEPSPEGADIGGIAPTALDPAAMRKCLDRLNALVAGYQTLPARSDPDDVQCGIAEPIAIQQIVEGVDISPVAELRCDAALTLALWVKRIVQPAAAEMPDRGMLTGLEQGSSYVCRRRNNAPDGKLSEHSIGNGIDIMAFRFADGAPIAVEPREREGTMAEAFQRTARAGACLYFTTVLGPGTDAAHADHLHMEIKDRNGGFRLCQ